MKFKTLLKRTKACYENPVVLEKTLGEIEDRFVLSGLNKEGFSVAVYGILTCDKRAAFDGYTKVIETRSGVFWRKESLLLDDVDFIETIEEVKTADSQTCVTPISLGFPNTRITTVEDTCITYESTLKEPYTFCNDGVIYCMVEGVHETKVHLSLDASPVSDVSSILTNGVVSLPFLCDDETNVSLIGCASQSVCKPL